MPPGNGTAAPVGSENGTLHVAIETGRTSRVVGIDAADVDALRDLIARHGARAERVPGKERRVPAGSTARWPSTRWFRIPRAFRSAGRRSGAGRIGQDGARASRPRPWRRGSVAPGAGADCRRRGAPAPGEGADIADARDQGASAWHLRPAAPFEGLRGGSCRCEDGVRRTVPGRRFSGSRRSRPGAMRW